MSANPWECRYCKTENPAWGDATRCYKCGRNRHGMGLGRRRWQWDMGIKREVKYPPLEAK